VIQSKEAVTVSKVAQAIDAELMGDGRAAVTDVTHDSRQAKEGSLFVAIRGELFDAHKFVPQVIEQGTVGILSELGPPAELQSGRGLAPAAWLQVNDVRRAMALAAAEVHQMARRRLRTWSLRFPKLRASR